MERFVVGLTEEEELLQKAIEPLLDNEGYELIDIRLIRAQHKSQLAIYVDTKDEKDGIVMEQLRDISGLLSDVLDASFAEDPILKGRYDLEVSSPGLDRPLTKVQHFKDAVGKRVKLRFGQADENGVKNVTGVVLDALVDGLILKPDSSKAPEVKVSYDRLARANVIFDFSGLKQPKKNS